MSITIRPRQAGAPDLAGQSAEEAVGVLYEAHALELVRLALVMVGDRPSAEDVVQEAFLGLYRRWSRLKDPAKALAYLRSSVLNGSRSVLRRRSRRRAYEGPDPHAVSAESQVLASELRGSVLKALRMLPRRQRETLVLRHVFDLSEEETAEAMRVSRGTVKSNASRGRDTLRRLLEEDV